MNLKSFSEKLGLSPTTVSRALNGYPEVSEKTRDRVLRAAEEMNYRPNQFAKSLATGKTGHIGLIYPVEHSIITPLFNEFLGGITQKLVEAGLDLSIMPTEQNKEMEAYRRVVESGRVDGLIVGSTLRQDPRLKYLITTQMPFVAHGRMCEEDWGELGVNPPFSYLDVDNFGAFYKATRLLINLGHRNIALLNGNQDFTFAYHRYKGYERALEEAGLAVTPNLIFTQNDMAEIHGYDMTCQVLNMKPRPTAIISSSMILILGVRRAIRDYHLSIGRDISVITYDDGLPYLECSKFDPSITTVYSAIRQAGYEITHHLQQIIQSGGKHSVRKVLDVDLIVRDSTCAVACSDKIRQLK